MFASNNHVHAARTAAQSAKNDAADAFVALDETQKTVTMVAQAYANLDAGPQGRALLAELAPVTTAADTASGAWIAALDAHQDTMDRDDADAVALTAAEQAFTRVRQQLDAARGQLQQFSARHADVEQKVAAAMAQLAPKTQAATQQLGQARAAAAKAKATGIVSADLDTQLARVEQLGVIVTEGPHKHGAVTTFKACTELAAAAQVVVTTAGRLVALVPDTQRRLVSTRTRLDGIAGRLDQVPATLSTLRRQFSAACSDDLDLVPAEGSRALEEARRLLTHADTHARSGAWTDAAAALDQCRSHLGVAETGVNAVVERLRDLQAVAADPTVELNKARFAVRDAQRLVVSAGSRVSANEVRVLDSLVTRLATVEQRLVGTHPDYWAYLVELRAVHELASAVVRRTRAALANHG